MSYVRGRERNEVELLPACLEDYVGAESAVRFIDAYVESVDFEGLGFKHAVSKSTGRPPYHPADLLKLYLYGYLNRIRSSRRLEAEAGRNLEVIWLLRGLRPDFKTIADFRKDNRQVFKSLFKDFNLLCRQLGLFGAELVAIDGAKFKGLNNTRRQYTAQELRELVQKIETRIEEYLRLLDEQDEETAGRGGGPTREELAEKIAQLKSRQATGQEFLGHLEQSGQKQIARTDPDSRKMKGAHGEHFLGYNVQVAVDGKHDLIVAQEVVQSGSDRAQLAGMAIAAKAELKASHLQVVADKGYHDFDQLASCEQAGVEPFVPAPGTTSGLGRHGERIFAKEQFHYDAAADVYHCPGGHILPRAKQDQSHGKERVLYYHAKVCRPCHLKSQCTTAAYRMIAQRPNEAAAQRASLRVAERPDLVARRKEIVEHVLGTLRNWHHDRFLLKGLEKVRAEFTLSALVYNLRRAINLVTLQQWKAAI